MLIWKKSDPSNRIISDTVPDGWTHIQPCEFPKWNTGTESWEFDRNAWLNKLVRPMRNDKLTECDWTQLPDAQLTSEQKIAWTTYRQALRNLPNNDNLMPDNITWPEVP